MPVHDWSRVDAGVFYAFHMSWVCRLMGALNQGVLPESRYALESPRHELDIPEMIRIPHPEGSDTASRRVVAIRHVQSHRLVAMIEVISPADKERKSSVLRFAGELESALTGGIHVLLVDLFPPGRHDPGGMHGAVWSYFEKRDEESPSGWHACLASYEAGPGTTAYVEHLRHGSVLPAMPLFLECGVYVGIPLEVTYNEAFRCLPRYHRNILETD